MHRAAEGIVLLKKALPRAPEAFVSLVFVGWPTLVSSSSTFSVLFMPLLLHATRDVPLLVRISLLAASCSGAPHRPEAAQAAPA